jgi:hypothetical protein
MVAMLVKTSAPITIPAIGKTIERIRASTPRDSFLTNPIIANMNAASPKNGGNNRSETPAKIIAKLDRVLFILCLSG